METWNKFEQFKRFFTGGLNDREASEQSLHQVKYKHISDTDSEEATDFKADLLKPRSIDEILDDIGLRLFHLKAFLLLSVLNITDSLEVSILSIILPRIKSEWDISSLLAGLLTLSLSIGMMLGSWFWGWIADKYGRKPCFVGSAIFILVFAFASVFSPNYYWLWISLFLVGFGVATTFETYVMAMELFPPKYRSMFATLNSVSWTVGFLLSSIISLELSEIGNRWTLGFVCFPTAFFLIGIVFLPDTPHYHLAAGDEQKALNILQNFAPEMDLSNIKLRGNRESKRADISQLFRSGYWKITVCACIANFACVMEYYVLVYTASDLASNETDHSRIIMLEHSKLVNDSSGNLYSIMAWMSLPELAILITVATSCCFFAVKNVLLPIFFLPIVFQIVALLIVNQRTALLVVTVLTRSLLMSAVTVVLVYASLLYPTVHRSIGVGACASVGRVGMALGPFIFEAVFVQAFFYGTVFNIGVLLLGFTVTALLPSRTSAVLS